MAMHSLAADMLGAEMAWRGMRCTENSHCSCALSKHASAQHLKHCGALASRLLPLSAHLRVTTILPASNGALVMWVRCRNLSQSKACIAR